MRRLGYCSQVAQHHKGAAYSAPVREPFLLCGTHRKAKKLVTVHHFSNLSLNLALWYSYHGREEWKPPRREGR
jgi:hypothetical protein